MDEKTYSNRKTSSGEPKIDTNWIVPFIDQPPSFWEEISASFGKYIQAVYCPLPGGETASGRPLQPEQNLEKFLHQALLSKAILVNPIILNQPVRQIDQSLIERLKYFNEYYGVCNVTVASLELAKVIREALPNFRITASILMGIHTPAQVIMVRDYVDVIVPDNRILHDLMSLRKIKEAFSGEICIIVNEACLPGCPYRTQHFYDMAYGDYFPESLCQSLLEDQPWLSLTGGWILPQHLGYYEGLYDSLKIAGRVTLQNPDHYKKVISAYIHRTPLLPWEIGGGPASVVAPIQITDDLFETMLNCDKNCGQCKFCEQYYENSISNPAN